MAPPHIKLEKPPKFSGKHSELENFLFAMQLYLDSSGLTGQNAARFLVSYLVGDALTWWRQYCMTHGGIHQVFSQVDADDLMDHLAEQFTDVNKQMHVRSRLFALRQ